MGRVGSLANSFCFHAQDEHKKLEDSEKKSRESLGERIEGILWDVDEVMEQKENPESQKLNMEMDDLYDSQWDHGKYHPNVNMV